MRIGERLALHCVIVSVLNSLARDQSAPGLGLEIWDLS
jgi:hypothetical protein